MAYIVDIVVGDTGEGFVGYKSDSGMVCLAVSDGIAAFRQKLVETNREPENFEHLKINLRRIE